MRVERIYVSDALEKFKISAGSKSIIIQGNRPGLKNKTSKKKRIKWELSQGNFTDPAALAMVILELEKHLGDMDEGDKESVALQK